MVSLSLTKSMRSPASLAVRLHASEAKQPQKFKHPTSKKETATRELAHVDRPMCDAVCTRGLGGLQIRVRIHRLRVPCLVTGSLMIVSDSPVSLPYRHHHQGSSQNTGRAFAAERHDDLVAAHRSTFLEGDSLHADHLIDANDRDDLERLCRYGARSPIANTRPSLDPAGRIVVSLKRPLRDGRTDLTFTPIDFLRRLAPLIPPPRRHLTHHHGVFAPHHHLRAATVHAAAADQPHSAPRRRLPWADLLKRVFAVDVLVCDTCGGSMRIFAVLPAGEASRAILEHLGLPTQPPPHTRAPPGRRFDDT
jgi:hypothetical protein